ncbi:MAG: bile acid:sodium symporter family protein, partial [Nitrososphaerales archaeon]
MKDGSAGISVFSSYLPLWLAVGIAAGYFGSPVLSAYAHLAPLTLSVMMFAVGLTTPLRDFRTNLRAVIPGTLIQWSMPFAGYAVGILLQLPAEVTLSLVVLGAVSNALSANVFVKLARGQTALSSMISVTSTFGSLLTVPLFTYILFSRGIPIDPSSALLSLLIYVIVPLVIGLYLGHRKRWLKEESWTGVASLALVLLIVLSSSQLVVEPVLITVLAATLLMNLGGYGIGYIASRGFGFDRSTGILV